MRDVIKDEVTRDIINPFIEKTFTPIFEQQKEYLKELGTCWSISELLNQS